MLSFPFNRQPRDYSLYCSIHGVVMAQVPLFHVFVHLIIQTHKSEPHPSGVDVDIG